MELIDQALQDLGSAIDLYVKKMDTADSKERKEKARRLFWQQCEQFRQRIIDECMDLEKKKTLRQAISRLLLDSFDAVCPNESARQLDAWAYSRPSFGKYISG